MYLAEELIPIRAGEAFVKYIHNDKAKPNIFFNMELDEVTEFLAFTQHVQYITTNKLTYISDYQGHGSLLTDSQILTNPELGKDLFGGGNLRSALINFEDKHACNEFCKWPGFGLSEFGFSDDESDADVQTGS
ncbi:hypothetical protein EV363DRAFT_1223459 [Boletus edulis]|nr:hypothetical protein EV363DRAFT_1223459 [Boletus edulis]